MTKLRNLHIMTHIAALKQAVYNGKAMKGTFLALTRQIIFLLPLIVVLPMIFGINGIMYAAPIADGGAAVISIIVIRGIFRKMGE